MTAIIPTSSKINPAKLPPITTAKFLSVRIPMIIEESIVTDALSVVVVVVSFGFIKIVVLLAGGVKLVGGVVAVGLDAACNQVHAVSLI